MMAKPGGFSGYLGKFLTQFYYLSFIGPLILTILILVIYQLTIKILRKINQNTIFILLGFLPALYSTMIMCDRYYPLSSIIGFIIAIFAGYIYIIIKTDTNRFFLGFILIPLTYWLAGGAYFMLLAIMLVWEAILYDKYKSVVSERKDRSTNTRSITSLKAWYFPVFLLLASMIPLLVKRFLIHQPLIMTYMSEFYYNVRTVIPIAIPLLLILPIILMVLVYYVSIKEKYFRLAFFGQILILLVVCYLGFNVWVNFEAEEIMTYDYLVRNERWDKVLEFAEKNPPRNNLSLSMLNLSLAKTGQLGNRMFNYDQQDINGLFLPSNKEYVTAMIGNEIFYHLGLTNASQKYAFEGMETIPNRDKSVRLIKRLAETNLINGHYKVSEKYLKLLEKTIFYRKWAKETKKFLNNEDMINNHLDWGEKRKFMVKTDYFFFLQNIEVILHNMVKENPDNKIASEYLMAFYLINKDLGNFMNCIPIMDKIGYKQIPVSYQEALLYLSRLINEDLLTTKLPEYISEKTKANMRAYMHIINTYPDAQERLRKDFSGTYWYYLHFSEIEKSVLER